MTLFALTAMAAATVAQLDAASALAVMGQVQISQLQIEQSTIIRIRPATVTVPNTAIPQMRWHEKKGPNCIQVNSLAGALVSSADSIDILLRGGTRLRARLEKSCAALDFNQGFYVKPSKDGRICEDRDTVRSRMGAECQIDKFKTLVPDKGR
jgi:hypothetical protein